MFSIIYNIKIFKVKGFYMKIL